MVITVVLKLELKTADFCFNWLLCRDKVSISNQFIEWEYVLILHTSDLLFIFLLVRFVRSHRD